MNFLIKKLLFPSTAYPESDINLSCKDHVVFGPTDTGKTYIVEAIKFILGGKAKNLRDIGYSDRYDQVALQVDLDGKPYTIYRDLSGKRHNVYEGYTSSRPKTGKVKGTVNEFLINSIDVCEYKILTKSGVLGGITSGDLRRVSLFSENDTLSLDAFEGSDSNSLVRNRASLSVFLTGQDDKDIELVVSTDQRNEAKGRVSFIEEQMSEIRKRVPEKYFLLDLKEEILKVDLKIEGLNNIEEERSLLLKNNRKYYFDALADREKKNKDIHVDLECRTNFKILHDKLNNDFERLTTLSTFSEISKHYQRSLCPVCDGDINEDMSGTFISVAAKVESDRINYHLIQVKKSIKDLDELIERKNSKLNTVVNNINELQREYEELYQDYESSEKDLIMELYDLRTDLIQWDRDKEQYHRLDSKLIENKERTKNKKQEVNRDLDSGSKEVVSRVRLLLEMWGVPDVKLVGFNKENVDITINGRERISFGKGKRGIFLSAYVIALMELALEKCQPHLGFVIIDSPVVTYKDPKHSKDATEADELLDLTVKDKFYKWLFERNDKGQVIILENEEPLSKWLSCGMHTEFTGENSSGRKGLFPIDRN